MATAPVKSQPLHNFSLSFLKWGTHSTTTATATSSPNSQRRQSEPDPDSDSDRAHLSAVRTSRVGSRSTRVHRFSFSSLTPSSSSARPAGQTQNTQKEVTALGEQEGDKPVKEEQDVEGEEEEEGAVQRPWNLRPRRGPACSTKNGVLQEMFGGDCGAQEGKQRAGSMEPKSMRLRGLAAESAGAAGGDRKKEKLKFWISLSRDEIEEDVFIMTGSRPARRPKKRPKIVQKQLDNVFPGLWLVGMTADSYRVADPPVKR
ncbi:uncharacterized protein LOC110811464 isoform X2 [Carica papaya]|uniref:uncharacterized protein LOC110811464 isoform X2 n=1 Tax=Carica papaya TaxID=3649 RepID=UPI000B8C94ED|nr:uncharacterized protein LOC110811464 isoform X2 [Carica papaya]